MSKYVCYEWVNGYGAKMRITYSEHIKYPQYWVGEYKSYTLNTKARTLYYFRLMDNSEKNIAIDLPFYIYENYKEIKK